LQRLVVAGGVSANRRLREGLQAMAKDEGNDIYYPRLEFCTDNGAMIAYAGYQRLRIGQSDPLSFGAWPRWALTQSAPLHTDTR
jgi:N6-L-threonylcarbamoyladenine synthase